MARARAKVRIWRGCRGEGGHICNVGFDLAPTILYAFTRYILSVRAAGLPIDVVCSVRCFTNVDLGCERYSTLDQTKKMTRMLETLSHYFTEPIPHVDLRGFT